MSTNRPDMLRRALVAGGALAAAGVGTTAWRTNQPGAYTFFAQMIDRDLNYSAAAAVHFEIVPPFYANAWIMVPTCGVLLGLVGWTFVARSLVVRRKREAERRKAEAMDGLIRLLAEAALALSPA